MIDETKTMNKNLEHKKNMKLNHPPTGKYFDNWNLSLRFIMWSNMVSIILKRHICGWICYDCQSSNPACNSLDKATSGPKKKAEIESWCCSYSKGMKLTIPHEKKKHDLESIIYIYYLLMKMYDKVASNHPLKSTSSWQNVVSFTKSHFLALRIVQFWAGYILGNVLFHA